MSTIEKFPFLKELGINEINSGSSTSFDKWGPIEGREILNVITPITGEVIAKVAQANAEDYEKVVKKAEENFLKWRMIPAPKRGDIVRQLGNELRAKKEALGKLVTLEMGKIVVEGMGEVQEMIDICDMAVGMSRQLFGSIMQSERPLHKMYEQWHPLGIVGIISAFNFPVSVWSWNSTIAAICGDTMIWKPSSKTPLTAIAVQNICNKVMKANG